MERFRASRRRLFELQWRATRLRERPVAWSLVLVLAANIVVFWSLANAAIDGTLSLDRVVTYATAAVTTSMIAFGGLSWALDGAAAPVAATLRLEESMGPAGSLVRGSRAGLGHAGTRDPLSQRHLCLPDLGRARARQLRSHDPRRDVARHRRPERRRQDDSGEAPLPALRPASRRHRD